MKSEGCLIAFFNGTQEITQLSTAVETLFDFGGILNTKFNCYLVDKGLLNLISHVTPKINKQWKESFKRILNNSPDFQLHSSPLDERKSQSADREWNGGKNRERKKKHKSGKKNKRREIKTEKKKWGWIFQGGLWAATAVAAAARIALHLCGIKERQAAVAGRKTKIRAFLKAGDKGVSANSYKVMATTLRHLRST